MAASFHLGKLEKVECGVGRRLLQILPHLLQMAYTLDVAFVLQVVAEYLQASDVFRSPQHRASSGPGAGWQEEKEECKHSAPSTKRKRPQKPFFYRAGVFPPPHPAKGYRSSTLISFHNRKLRGSELKGPQII